MLVLTRLVGEQVVVPQCQLTVTVLDATAGRVRLGIAAPAHLVVHRREVYDRIQAEEHVQEGRAIMSARILLADRDAFLLAGYREHLSRHGAVVATATTGLACLDRLRDFAPDVLVLDPAILWGGGDGVLAVINEEPKIRPAAVLLLTHGDDRSLLYRLSSFRVDDYQAKPISPGQLLHRISSLPLPPNAEAPPDTNGATSRGASLAVKR